MTSDNLSPDDIGELLDRLAIETGNPIWRAQFHRMLRARFQQSPGRPQIDDRWKLADARALLESGAARSFHGACIRIARQFSGEERRVKSIAERLRRKHAREKKHST